MREEFRSGPATEVVLRVRETRLPLVLGSLSVTMLGDAEPVADDPGAVRVPVRSLRGAEAMLVGFGSEAEVREPGELRELIAETAREAYEHHRT